MFLGEIDCSEVQWRQSPLLVLPSFNIQLELLILSSSTSAPPCRVDVQSSNILAYVVPLSNELEEIPCSACDDNKQREDAKDDYEDIERCAGDVQVLAFRDRGRNSKRGSHVGAAPG